jgi:hypothetical protein
VILTRAVLCLAFALLVSCNDQPPAARAIGDAYVGPTTLNLREQLALRSPVSATVKHGEKLEIIEYRHRLVKVRTEKGAEGWTDLRDLLTPEQMDQLHAMAKNASHFPSQGSATVFDALNLHTEPNRTSPSFAQIPENGKADVIGHKLMPRFQPDDTSTPEAVKPTPRRRKRSKSSQTRIGPLPHPFAPMPPANWVALSVPKAPEPPPAPVVPPAPVPMDDWSLVRTPDGKVGWVLTRPLILAIPDEVAQYAEGHRITSYFSLGRVDDNGTVKNNWLWTTIAKGGQPYEFDSFRVFVWSLRHHRYETAYIERNVEGHFPSVVNRTSDPPSFSVIVDGADGSPYRKTYAFDGFRIRMTAKEPYAPAADLATAKSPAAKLSVNRPVEKRSWYARFRDRIHRLVP